jgi:glutaminyl-peptide cyclotransferase
VTRPKASRRLGAAVKASMVALAFLLISSCRGEREVRAGKFDGESAIRYAKVQLDFGPRIPGTQGSQRAGDWLIQQMKLRADTVIVQEWTHTTVDGKQLPMRNIIARFKPQAAEHILYVTHWDTRPISDGADNPADKKIPVPGADDGAAGVGLFVALGDALKKNPPASGVDLLFVDGEDYGAFDDKAADVLIGSTYFAANPVDPGYKPIFGVLWDMIGQKDLTIRKEAISMQEAPEVVDRVWQTAKDLGHDDVFVAGDQGGITDDHVPLIKAGMRVIDVIDLDYSYHHKPTDTIDKISARSLSIVGDVAEALLR